MPPKLPRILDPARIVTDRTDKMLGLSGDSSRRKTKAATPSVGMEPDTAPAEGGQSLGG